MPIVSLVVAVSLNNVIGVNNRLPWHIPEDLKRFRALTLGHAVIMGRKTYESLPKALDGRLNVVLSRQANYAVASGVRVVQSLDEALAGLAEESEVFVIGGATLYRLALPYAQKLYLTRVGLMIEGDTYFPCLEIEQWQEKKYETFYTSDGLTLEFFQYKRIV